MDTVLNNDIWNLEIPTSVLQMQQKVLDGLKPKQRAKITELREKVKEVLSPSHNDFFLLKWLRARKFDLAEAEKMLRANLNWRIANGMDTVHENFKPAEVLRKYLPLGIDGQDKNGCPIWILTLGTMDVRGVVYSAKLNDVIKYYVVPFEYMERVKIMQSHKEGKLITSHVVIADMDEFKLQDYIWKPIFEIFTSVMREFEANYPECLERVFIINAPKVFPIFFAMIKPFLSDATKNKITIHGRDNWKDALLEAIDADQLPQHWGGTQVDEVDGNPYCTSKIVIGRPVPKSYYLGFSRREAPPNTSLKTTTVEARNSITLDYSVDIPGSTLTWTFGTAEHDIAFGVSYKGFNDDLEGDTEIFPVARVECQFVPEEGQLLCQKAGIYEVTFDNSYSWYKSKKVYYEVKVIPPMKNENDVGNGTAQ